MSDDSFTSGDALRETMRVADALDLTPDGRRWVPGPWTRGEKTGQHRNSPIYVYDDEDTRVADTDSEEVATFLAHCHPLRVKALVEEILSLRRRLAVGEQLPRENESMCNECASSDFDPGTSHCSRCGGVL